MAEFIDVILPIPQENLFTCSTTNSIEGFLAPDIRLAKPFCKEKYKKNE